MEVANKFTDGDVVNANLGKYKQNTNERSGKAPSSPKRKYHKCKDDFVGTVDMGGGKQK